MLYQPMSSPQMTRMFGFFPVVCARTPEAPSARNETARVAVANRIFMSPPDVGPLLWAPLRSPHTMGSSVATLMLQSLQSDHGLQTAPRGNAAPRTPWAAAPGSSPADA